jgi:Lrp/AsnC family transcriptional regulator, regulator for asnA, asnC and gidA
MDPTDKKILDCLLEDGRQSLREVAKKSGVSVVTVMKRLNALEKEGYVKGYTAILDHDRLGYEFPVAIRISISKGKLFDVEQRIANHPCVFAIYDITGDFDSLVLAKFKTRRQLDNFLKKVQSFEFVERTETNLILNIIKETALRLE